MATLQGVDYGFLITLRQIRAFEAVARLQSINAAASEIRISQPAVWQAIAKLEQSIGTRLFDRRSTGTYLNGNGLLLLPRVQRFTEQFGRAIAKAAGIPRGDTAQLARVQREITTAQFRTLIASGDAESSGDAARLLGISEAALRRAARSLEETVGRPLFDRSAAGSILNRAGVEFARQLHLAVLEIRHAVEDLRASESMVAGRVVVGSLPLVQTLFLPRAIEMFLDQYPEASIEIREGSYPLLMQQLRKGALDMIVGALRNNDCPRDVVEKMLFVDPFAIVLRRDHPLTRRPQITLEELAEFDWVVPRQGTPIRRTFETLFAGSAPQPRANIETSSLSALRAILTESDRLTILSRRQIAIDEQVGLLTILPYPLPVASRPIGLTTRRSWGPARVQHEFMRMLEREAEEVTLASPDGLPWRTPGSPARSRHPVLSAPGA